MKTEKKYILGIIILIIILIANLVLLFGILNSQKILINYQSYYFEKTENLNHQERELTCKNHDLDYIKSLQNSKEIVTCCQLNVEDGAKHIDFCENILAG
ncbi:hypothetical protein HYT25_02840 [Candidatus Pacearchaeota archaeon]|nr:hypothetical protein [Candidatus Pacearchaeota archaeon]